MNQQENETVDYLMSEENDEQDFFQFADLEVTDEQLAEIKGGWWCTQCGVALGNHNETTVSDETDEAETEALDDLPVDNDEQVKGGPGSGSNGGVWLNHNETISADDEAEAEAETEALDDLPVQDDEQVKGGPSGGITKLGSKLLN